MRWPWRRTARYEAVLLGLESGRRYVFDRTSFEAAEQAQQWCARMNADVGDRRVRWSYQEVSSIADEPPSAPSVAADRRP